jgi:protein-S-isoprenylcysteine O-methyltransferase Ste14
MGSSWRIGLDNEKKKELVQTGLFSISRNPIFAGMTTTLFGLFLVLPNAVTLLVLICGYLLIQIQIRLEEEFLLKQHGEKYLEYFRRVKRLI